MADSEKSYMRTPLVLWVETFKANDGHPLEYRDLYDGVFLNDVMQQIDPRSSYYDNVSRCVDDVTGRLHNWDILVKNIRGFYTDVLQQLLIMRLPNINAICREPGKDSSFAEIRKALLLILGCAVQCEHKETFIDKIMAMDITAQTEIVDNIKEVTDDFETVLPTHRPQSPTSSNGYIDKMFHHLSRLIRERDECAELAADLGQERDFYMSQAEGKPVVDTPQMSPDKHHLALELAECKAKLRHIRQELEDRQEQLSDVKYELQESVTSCSQLKNENALLAQEARATRSLRDELDIVKEKAAKVDMYEKEILKYKERLNELEFYKARTEELKEDNSILEETKAMLEDQLANSRKRIETVMELETELSRYRQQQEEMSRERDADREKIEYLTEENARLEFEKKSSMNESASLETELSAARSRIGNMGSSLSEQFSETSHARILRLELENQRLAAKLAEMKETSLIQSAEISLELEKENQRLSKKIEKLQTSACESSEEVVRMEDELTTVREERERLLKALDAVKENSERQVQELERENEQLTQALNSIRERNEKTSDMRLKDLERENKRLHEAVTVKNSQLTKLEFDHRQLQRSSHQLNENTQRVKELEQENQAVEKENADLHQKVATLQHTQEKLEVIEQENSDLGVENRKLQKTVETLQAAAQRREQLEQDHISLTVEHQRLQRTLESLKSESDRALELESEKDSLNKELQQLRKSLEGQKTQKLKQEQMEFELIDMTNENQRLQKSMEVTTKRLHQLEKDNMDIETENERLSKEVETLKVAAKRLEDRDKEATQLEGEVQRLQKDKAALEKENRKLKQSSELKDSSLEEITAKFQSMDKESKSLRRSVDKMKETCSKVKDLEKENKELLQELNTDRKTLATLREDLVNEKIKSQELSNELEQLTGELQKVGINTEKLTMAEQTKDANRYKALETMIEETLKKSSELKEEKIRALETRLEESKSRNMKLQDDLRTARRESEGLKQRYEEEIVAGKDSPEFDRQDSRNNRSNSTNATKEILQLKDHLVELERQNAKLMAETDNLHSNNTNMKESCLKLETQVSNLQSQHATLQGYYSSMQEQNAKLQVEYTTLQSQASSAVAQQDTLKHQLSRLELDHENLAQTHEGLQRAHQALVSDHESLQHLHEQLTAEYESLVSEHGSLKSMHKNLKMELKDLQEQLENLLRGKDDVNKLRDTMERERDQLKRELMSLGNLQSDHHRLTGDHQQLREAYDKLSQDYSNILASHKQVNSDYKNLQLKSTELQGELNEAKENMSVADVEFQKLESKMETIYHINERIENENQALLMQIKQLLNQNQELLTQALNSKDHFAEEEKAYLEKLSELRRQKERLEEKIMEHYKNRISPKKKGLGALIARKARGIISRGPRRSKSRQNLTELNDNSSQGSGSTEHVNDASRRLGAKSTEDVSESVNNDSGLLPGLGRPYTLDDVNGSGPRATTPGPGRKTPGRSSPGSEMLTLDQFLKEANKSQQNSASSNVSDGTDEQKAHNPVQRRVSNESGSRSSEHSNTSNSRLQQHRYPHQQQHQDGSIQFRPDVPDVAASSMLSPALNRDLSNSRMSRLSAGSGNENSSFGSSGALPNDVFTSTPKTDNEASAVIPHHSNHFDGNVSSSRLGDESLERHSSLNTSSRYMSQKRLSGDDWRSSSQESSPYASTNRVNVLGNQPLSSSPRAPPSAPHNQSSSSSIHPPTRHQQQHPSSQGQPHSTNAYSNRGRDLPAVPTEPAPGIPATERLDRLTMLSSSSESSSTIHYAQPVSVSQTSGDADRSGHMWSRDRNSGSTRDSDRDPRSGGDSDLHRRKSQGAADRPPQGLPNQFQPPVPRSQPPSISNNPQQNLDNSVVSGHNPRRPPANVVQNPPQARSRPASAMGQSPHVRGVYSRPPGEGRPRQQQGGPPGQIIRRDGSINMGDRSQADQNFNNSNSGYNQRPVAERPKSVPPHLFNKTDDSSGGPGREIPVPPPRRTRDTRDISSRDDMVREAPDGREPRDSQGQPFSNVSLIREPGRPSSRLDFNPDSQGSRPPQQQQQQPRFDHQQPYHTPQQSQSVHPSLANSRQNSGGYLPSSHTQGDVHPSRNSASLDPSARPSTMGQHSSTRPDSLPIGHQSGSGPGQPHARPGYGGPGPSPASGRPPPNQPSTLPRSQSSMANPIANTSFSASRSSTPGPHPGRRDVPPGQYNRDRDSQDGGQGQPGGPGYPSGPAPGYHGNQHGPDSSRDPRQYRSGSEPRDLPTAPHPGGYPTSSSPRQQQQQHQVRSPSDSYPQSSTPLSPPARSHSQGPPQHRKSGGPSSRPEYIPNGPNGPYGGPQGQPLSSPQQQQQQAIPPQIRSQGKPSSNYYHQNSIPSTTSRQMAPSTQLRSPGEVTSPDRPSGLPPPLPNAAQISPQSKNSPNIPPRSEREAEGGQGKNTNSIWYEYGCV